MSTSGVKWNFTLEEFHMLSSDPTSENTWHYCKCLREARDLLLVCGQHAAEFKSEWKIRHQTQSCGLLLLSGWEGT
jgi:hypothetical protein